MLTASFFGAVNAWALAMLGEYVARIYDQVRGRPLCLVDRAVNVPTHGRRDGRADPYRRGPGVRATAGGAPKTSSKWSGDSHRTPTEQPSAPSKVQRRAKFGPDA